MFDDFIIDNEMGFGVSTTRYVKTITYHWGPDIFNGQVYLLKRVKRIETGRDYGWDVTESRTYPNSKIWNRRSIRTRST